MSDVGAVVLTMGEPSTEAALASVHGQSLPIEQVVVLEGIKPFHRALNSGADRIDTPFFIQVDADFVLDRDSARRLRDAMAPEVGVAVGALRDSLIGPVSGVKLFRRDCFGPARVQDTVTPDVDFVATLDGIGWRTRFVIGGGAESYTFGAHRPDYTVSYTFGTYYLLGARYAARGDPLGLLWRLNQLRRSRHPSAPVARVALGHGAFSGEARDVPKPTPPPEDAAFLEELAGVYEASLSPVDRAARLEVPSARQVLTYFFELGKTLRALSAARVAAELHALADCAHRQSWLAEVALSHGALAREASAVSAQVVPVLERLGSSRTPKLFPRWG